MKRLSALILVLAMCFSLAACNNTGKKDAEAKPEAVHLTVGSEIKTANATLKLLRVHENTDYTYYDDRTNVEMIFDIVNNGKNGIPYTEIITLDAMVAGEKCTNVTYIVSDDAEGRDTYEELAAGKSAKFIARLEVPTSEKEVSLKIKADGEKYTYKYTIGNDDKSITPVSFNTSFTVGGVGDFTITKLEATPTVRPVMGGSYSYSASSGNVYFDTVFSFTSSAASDISSEDIISATVKTASGTTYDNCFVYVENAGGTNISRYENIAPLSTVRLHTTVSVPENETSGEIEFEIGGSFFTISFDASKPMTNATALSIGNTIGTDSTSKAEFLSCEFVDAVYPSDASGYYTYYEVDDANSTYLALAFNVTNHGSTRKDVEDMIDATAKFAGKYTYNGFVVSENDDKSSLNSYNDIDPLETKKVYCLITVPKTVTAESYEVTVAFDCNEYIVTVNAAA